MMIGLTSIGKSECKISEIFFVRSNVDAQVDLVSIEESFSWTGFT